MEEVSELLESQTALMALNFIEKRSLLTLIMSVFCDFLFFQLANLVRGFSKIVLKGLVLGIRSWNSIAKKLFTVHETVCI